MESNIPNLVLITAGNAGYSLAKHVMKQNVNVFNVLDKSVSESIKEKLIMENSYIVEFDLQKTIIDTKKLIRLLPVDYQTNVWDVTNGMHNAYLDIVSEVRHLNINYIIVPFGSGEAFYGIVNAVHQHNLPIKVVGVRVENRLSSKASKLTSIWTPYENLNKYLNKTNHHLIFISELEVNQAYKVASEFITCEFSSSVVFAALEKLRFNEDDSVLLINSGRGIN